MTRIREASHTVACIDEYCAHYRSVFHNVRHFEQFTQLELGMLAEPNASRYRGSPRRCRASPALHHFLANADWSTEELRAIRLRLTREALAGRPLCAVRLMRPATASRGIPLTMRRPNTWEGLHRIEQGIVSANAYGVLDHVTFPLGPLPSTNPDTSQAR